MKYIFFLVALTIIFGMMAYVLIRILQVLPPKPNIQMINAGMYIFLLVLFITGFLFENKFTPFVSKSINFIGFTFLITVCYLFISFLIVDIIRLFNIFLHFAPAGMHSFRFWTMIGSLVVIALALVVGNYNFNHPKLVRLNLSTDRPVQDKEIKIVAASDIHLGSSIDRKMLRRYVDLINSQHPDIVFLLGDITDRSIDGLIGPNMQAGLKSIKAPLGIYAIYGNHEYYSGKLQKIAECLRASGVTVLQDSAVLVDSCFYVIGRDDRTNPHRKPLAELVRNLDNSRPRILLDHQPFNLEDAEQNGFDLQLSGHTHDGQIFPGNLLVKLAFELAHGYLKKGGTQYYVSSGLGLWGPEYRIGTQSELVEIRLRY